MREHGKITLDGVIIGTKLHMHLPIKILQDKKVLNARCTFDLTVYLAMHGLQRLQVVAGKKEYITGIQSLMYRWPVVCVERCYAKHVYDHRCEALSHCEDVR